KDRAKLYSYRSSGHYDQGFRDLFYLKYLITIEDMLAVYLKARNGTDHRSGCYNNVFGLYYLLAILPSNLYSARPSEPPHSLKSGDRVLFHKILDTLRVLRYDPIFSLLNIFKNEPDTGRLNAEILCVPHLLVEVR